MKRSFCWLTFFLLGLGVAPAGATPASSGEMVSYRSGSETVSGYLVKPAGQGPFPALVAMHEWWGLNEQVKGEARKLARQGRDRARRDLLAAFNYLAGRSDVRRNRIGSIGWCMGGGFSLQLARQQPRLAAAVIYYGRLMTEESSLKPIQAPILGLFGEEDRGIPASSVRAFEAAMQKLGKPIEVQIYAGAGHAFANQTRPSYRQAAARDAWEKTRVFLTRHLKGK